MFRSVLPPSAAAWRKARGAAASLLALAFAAAGGAQGAGLPPLDLDIPANSDVAETLRRIQTRSDTALPVQSLPLRSREASDWLRSRSLTPFDRAHLAGRMPGRAGTAVAWSDSARGHSFFLSPALEAGASRREGDSSGRAALGGLGLRVYGQLTSRLTFYSRGMAYNEATDRPQFTHQFDPEFGETYSVEKGSGDSLLSSRTFNRFEHYAILDLPYVMIKAGRDRVHTGPGYFSSLMASRDTPPYYLVEARVDFASWLRLEDRIMRMTDTRHDVRKYSNHHRFEFRPLPSLALGFQESVIYQDRDPDLRYVLPLTPLAFSEDNLGGMDNDAMGFDFLYSGLPKVSLWGELFIDDLLGPGAFFDDFWENRWAVLAGFQAVSPWPALDADVVVEYSRVEPWTYSGRDEHTSFKHFNVPSASQLGPDSRTWDIQLAWRPFPWMQLKQHLEIDDKGTQKGAILGAQHVQGEDPDTKRFLDGDVIERRAVTLEAGGLPGRFGWIRAWWTRDFGDADDQSFGAEASLLW